jgi:hypothetical protein
MGRKRERDTQREGAEGEGDWGSLSFALWCDGMGVKIVVGLFDDIELQLVLQWGLPRLGECGVVIGVPVP